MSQVKFALPLTVALVCALVLAAHCAPAIPSGAEQMALKEIDEQEQVGSVRGDLARLIFYHAQPIERQSAQANGAYGYKRSSSALDALTGVTLGKRAAPLELVNLEPIYGRHLAMRTAPRMYDLRWAPLDSFDGQSYQAN